MCHEEIPDPQNAHVIGRAFHTDISIAVNHACQVSEKEIIHA